MGIDNLQPGAIFGRDFRVVSPLRAGGMGAVYIVDQLSTGRKRALKVLAPELATEPGIRERFVLEARAASRIESDHVVEIVTAGVDEETGSPFLVMELLRGEELADALARLGPLPLGDVAEVLSQIGHALEHAHAQGIVHRDLKPENIFLAASRRRDASFTAKILDFGIAKLVADSASSQNVGTQPLGTPLFMSPEQTDRRGRISPATDVWALGLIAYRLLTGQDYWRGVDGSLPMLLREIVIDELSFASQRAREQGTELLLPPGFDAWFARCVNRDIDARFPEAGEAVRAFGELVTEGATRGKLVVQASVTGSAAMPASTGSASAPPVSERQVTPAGTDPFGPTVASSEPILANGVLGATAQALASSGALAAPGAARARRAPIVPIAAAFALLGGAAAFFLLRSGSDAGGGGPALTAQGPSAGLSAAPPASAAPVAPASRGTACPDGALLIAGSTAFLGADDIKDAAPAHEVTLQSFCLDRTEVTTGAYLKCFQAKSCPRPLEKVEWQGVTDKQRQEYSPFCNARDPDQRAEHPMNCVSWFMADTYCKKSGRRLPTEAEWELAARGADQRLYPWGDAAPSAKHLNACGKECAAWSRAHQEGRDAMYDEDDGFVATAPVGKFPAGASAAGVLDLAGNVWEWVADGYAPYTTDKQVDPKGPEGLSEFHVIRGGDFFSEVADWAKPARRYRREPNAYNHAIGFRCAADPR